MSSLYKFVNEHGFCFEKLYFTACGWEKNFGKKTLITSVDNGKNEEEPCLTQHVTNALKSSFDTGFTTIDRSITQTNNLNNNRFNHKH